MSECEGCGGARQKPNEPTRYTPRPKDDAETRGAQETPEKRPAGLWLCGECRGEKRGR